MKIKLIYCFVLFYNTATIIMGQTTVRFSNQHLINNNTAVSTNLIKYQNKYCLMGIGGNTLTNQYQGLCFLKTDSLGNYLSSKQIFHPANYGYYYNSTSNAFNKLDSTKALFTGQVELGVDYSKSALVKINLKTLDTLWTKIYSQPGDSTWLLCSTMLSDSNIISLGYKYYILNSNVYSKPFMMKVDKNGNYKWHKWINATFTTTEYLFQKIIKLNDNDFIVVGQKQSNICYPQAFVMRIDTSANKLYNVNFAGLPNSGVKDCIQLLDGNFLAVGSYATLVNCNANADKYKKYAYKFNPITGAKIISKTYNIPANTNGILTAVQKVNGEIITFGGTGATLPANTYNSQGDFLWINNNLDSLKSVFIVPPNVADVAVPNQAVLTSDGGFAAAIISYPYISQQKFWLIKADSNGCYTSTCAALGFEESAQDDGLKIYPNPTNGILNIEVLHENVLVYKQVKVEVINTLGEMVYTTNINKQLSTIDIKGLPTGIYQLRLIANGKQKVLKFIKD